MGLTPLPAHDPRRPRQRLVGTTRARRPPTRGGLLRRRVLITVTKFLLPTAALALLATIALWPEFDRATNEARVAIRSMGGAISGAEVLDARYHGVDEQGRPYTLTADAARQQGPDTIRLNAPEGDITLQNGSWIMIKGALGSFVQRSNQLDLWKDVTVYRDDGTTLYTQSMSMDLKNGAAAGSQPVHAEGPFGTLDAQGFALADKGSVIQFTGPAKLFLSGNEQP
ncbi:MAG: LPS export ABC transporter periplasmic protein LptC [Proteobacteria bacterium]|nr:LPS export ABC transporter periplasmic protein LptC [Pseudomonadota bacterium]